MSTVPTKISSLCEVTSSKRIYAKEYVESGIPFFRGKEVVEKYNGAIDVSTELFISVNRFDEIKNKFGAPQKGDLLLTSVGTIGFPYLVGGEFEFYFKDGNLTWFKSFNGINSQFLFYWLVSPQGKAELSKCTIGAAQPAYTIVRLKKMEINLPLEPEQEKIVSILATYDESIKNNRRRIQLLEESARLLYKEWFVQLRFPGHEHVKIVDGVPEGWEKSVVSDLGEVITGKTPSTKNEENFGNDVPFIKTPDLHSSSIVVFPNEYLSEKGANTQFKKYLPPYSILVACIGAKLGVVSFNRYVAQTNQQINAVIPRDNYTRYFSYFLLKDFEPRLKAIGGGATMPNVNMTKFSALGFLFPEKKLLELFNDYAQSSFDQIAQLIEMNQKLAQARDILLPRLMNGTLAV